MKNFKLHLIAFTGFFILFYIEIIPIGGVKIAILWKLVLIGIIILYLLSLKSIGLHKFIFWGYLYSFKNFINLSSFIYFTSNLAEVIKSAFIPLLAHFFIYLQEKKNLNLYKILLTISIYVIISTIPFLLGIIEPLGEGYDLSIFGLNAYGFVGIFQVPHAAAVTIAFAVIVLIYEFEKITVRKFKIIYLCLILLGLWVEIHTYARTGFAVLFIAGSYLLFVNKNIKYYFKISIPVILLGLVAYTYYQSSEVLKMRLEGTNKYIEQSDTKADLGSGRFKFQYYALKNWSSSDFIVISMGLGIGIAKDMMQKDVGRRIYSHNGFVDVLQFNGLIGIFLYGMFLFYMIVFILSNKSSPYYRLNIALLLAYTTSMFFQGEHFFLADVIFALGLALLVKKDNYEIIIHPQERTENKIIWTLKCHNWK